jgi:pimeloyl-ACP methyl ester carboxylesterase
MHQPRRRETGAPQTLRRLALAGLAALVCGAAALSGAGEAAASSSPALSPAGSLPWQPCGKHGAQCSSLEVPLDWTQPQGAQISLGVTALGPEDPARSLGVLFFNPGGPGGGTRQIVRDQAAEFFTPAILRRFEIVGVDPRGVKPSGAVTCTLPTSSPTVSRTPSTRAGYLRLLAYERKVGGNCESHTGPLLGNVDTVSTARDLDAVRTALGVEQVSWFGVSYGSLLGTTYAHLFPSHLRAAVLDGTLDHTVGSARFALDEARSTEAEFAAFAHWCDTHSECALHGLDVRSTYRSLLARARRHPIPARGIPGGADAETIGNATFGIMEIHTHWPLLATLLKAATSAHPHATLLAYIGNLPQDAAYHATTCQDFPSDIHDYADFRSLLSKLRRATPVIGPYLEGWNVDVSCMGWPVPARNPWGPVRVSGTPPLLVVGGAHDPSTPQVWARGLAHQIDGSRLLLWNGSGHTGYFNDASVKAREVAYLLDPTARVPGTIAG